MSRSRVLLVAGVCALSLLTGAVVAQAAPTGPDTRAALNLRIANIKTHTAPRTPRSAGGTESRKPIDLSVQLRPPLVTVGAQGTYRLVVKNAGPGKATGAFISFNIPGGMTLVGTASGRCSMDAVDGACKLGTILPRHAKVVALTLSAPDGAFGLARFYVAANEYDRDSTFNQVERVIAIQPQPGVADVAVSIAPAETPDYFPPGITFHAVTVSNSGPSVALRTLVTYDFRMGVYPSGGSLLSTITCGTSSASDDALDAFTARSLQLQLDKPRSFTFCIPRLAAGESRTFELGTGDIAHWVDTAPWTARVTPLTPDADETNNLAGAPPTTWRT